LDIPTDIIYYHVFVDGTIYHPSFNNEFYNFHFLIDTGASTTTVLPGDAKKMGINFSELPKRKKETRGIGKPVRPRFVKMAVIGFQSVDHSQQILLPLNELNILEPDDEEVDQFTYSLLGMDMIKRFEFCYNLPKVKFTLKDQYKRQGKIIQNST